MSLFRLSRPGSSRAKPFFQPLQCRFLTDRRANSALRVKTIHVQAARRARQIDGKLLIPLLGKNIKKWNDPC
jgi:hypothetical protein